MRKFKQLFIIVISTLTLFACSDDDDNQSQSSLCNVSCSIPVASNEFPATIPSGIVGSYTLTYTQINPGGPFSDGDTADFVLTADNKMIVTFGSQCVSIENPILFDEFSIEANFRDNCVFNVLFGASDDANGNFNEINVGTLGFQFLGQFN